MASVPELIDALVATLSADASLSGVVVLDGPQVTDDASPDWIIVGFDGEAGARPFDQGAEGASADHDWSGPLSTQQAERMRVALTVIHNSGDTDVRAARNRVYEVAARIRSLLRLNPGVGLPAVQAYVSASRLYQDQTPDGIQARLVLNLTADTFGL